MESVLPLDTPSVCTIQGRSIGDSERHAIRELIKCNPTYSRRRLSEELARLWQWQTATGQIKHFAAYSLLQKLEQRGWVRLPPRRRVAPRRRALDTSPELFDAPPSIQESLGVLLPLAITVLTPPTTSSFHRMLALHHYLGFRGPVGENMAYQVRDQSGRDVACALFGAAAWKVAPRDTWIGWSPEIRQKRLAWIANNSRFLILPWVKVPHLASHILGRIVRRISSDWQTKYGHPVHLLETFVERDRFKGTCYKAANWTFVGETQGRSRQDRANTLRVPVKDIYLYPLTPDFRKHLHG